MSFLDDLKKARKDFQVKQDTEAENRRKGEEEESVIRDRLSTTLTGAITEISGHFGWSVVLYRKPNGDVALITRQYDQFSALVYLHFEQIPGSFVRNISIRLSSTDRGITYLQSVGTAGFLRHLATWLAENERQ